MVALPDAVYSVSPQLTAPSNIEAIWQTLHRTFYRGGPILQSALSGIDIALWDLKARSLNLSVTSLLGGPVRSTLRVYAWIGGDRPSLRYAAMPPFPNFLNF